MVDPGSGLRVDDDINNSSVGRQSNMNRDPSKSMLSKSNIGAQSMQKLTQVASRAALSPNNEAIQAEISVSDICASTIASNL